MKKRKALLLILFTLVVSIISCKKTVNVSSSSTFTGNVTDYYIPMTIGKYAIYRLDSLNFYYYGQLDTITSYWAKDSVEKGYIDNSGDSAFLVTRYLSDTLGDGWTSSMTYIVTPSIKTVDVTENNLRFIKLAFPVQQGYDWSGNSYLPYAPYQDFFDYSDDSHLSLDNWTYTYQSVGSNLTISSGTYDSVATVLSADDSINVPITDVNSFASRTYWSESYAKHIGLIYRHTEMWEYQPPTPDGSQSGYKIGFQVTMTLLSHN